MLREAVSTLDTLYSNKKMTECINVGLNVRIKSEIKFAKIEKQSMNKHVMINSMIIITEDEYLYVIKR